MSVRGAGQRARDPKPRVVRPARAGFLEQARGFVGVAQAQIRVGDHLVHLGTRLVAGQGGLPRANGLADLAPSCVARAQIEHAGKEIRRCTHRRAELIGGILDRTGLIDLQPTQERREHRRLAAKTAGVLERVETPGHDLRSERPGGLGSRGAVELEGPCHRRSEQRGRHHRCRIEHAHPIVQLVLEHVVGRDRAIHRELAEARDARRP